MPIRMVDDPEDESSKNERDDYRPNPGGGGGGGINIGSILSMLLPFLIRRPKLLLMLGGVFVLFYFFGGGLLGGGGGDPFAKGATLDQDKYDKAEVFAGLDPTRNTLPEATSLIRFAPPRLNQGQQGSCVAWSSAYSARSILQARATGKDPSQVAFSPSFMYNQINLPNCQGSYIPYAMELMKKQGALPFNDFAYDENSCAKQPSTSQKEAAGDFKIRGYQRLSKDGSDYGVDMQAIKQNLAQGGPVVIGMMVGGTFMENMMNRKIWIPAQRDYSQRGFGGHAMCVIGYDDNYEGGSFQIMNSWGKEWGENGVGWVRYKDFEVFVKEAYGLYPMGAATTTDASKFAVQFGLIDNSSQKNIDITQKAGNLFATKTPVKKGTKFKIQITNSLECYTYIFGQETDGSSYVLFPYSEKHSPFCGITGTRTFPKKQSLMADEKGAKDFMAIVVTKQPVDYAALNKRINDSKKASYAEKVNEALGAEAISTVAFKANNGLIGFETEAKNSKNMVAMTIELDKN